MKLYYLTVNFEIFKILTLIITLKYLTQQREVQVSISQLSGFGLKAEGDNKMNCIK